MRDRFILLVFICTVFLLPLVYSQVSEIHSTQLTNYLSEKEWNKLFPNRYRVGRNDLSHPAIDFYSWKSFQIAVSHFPLFLGEGNDESRKRELAAFLANIAQETSGGWAGAPGGYFKWGLYFLEENSDTSEINRYADTTKKNYPPQPGTDYFGRGPLQLSWNYNYGMFSEYWFGNKDTLLKNPGLLSDDPVLSFGSAIWFWMTAQGQKPSCHDVITGVWKPDELDISKGRLPGFGLLVNIINGVVECGYSYDEHPKTISRYNYYKFFCDYFHVLPGDHISCGFQTPYGH